MKAPYLKTLSICAISLLLFSCSKGPSSSSSKETESSVSSSEEESSVVTKGFVLSSAPYYKPAVVEGEFKPSQKSVFGYGYFEDKPQIVYMDLGVALKEIYNEEVPCVKEGGSYVYNCKFGEKITISPSEKNIVIHDFDQGNLFSRRYDVPLGLIDSEAASYVVDNSGCTFVPNEDITLDLGKYSLDIVEHIGKAYLPFPVVDLLTFSQTLYSPVAFNGSGFYFIDNPSGAMSLSYRDNPYVKAYYSGKNSQSKKESYFIEYNANMLFFTLDYFFGFRDERFAPFAPYLEKNHKDVYDGLYSSDETTYCNAVSKLMNYVIGDGHTNGRNASSSFGEGSVEFSLVRSERSDKLSADRSDCSIRREQAKVETNVVRYSGDTAILSFDSFSHCGQRLTADNIATLGQRNQDSYALLLSAMNQIEERGGIHNVIFDVTCNGGGDSNSLIPMLGIFQSNLKTIAYDPLSKAHAVLNYKIDTNLDGKFDNNDGYKGKYEFFVLTSSYSFSCANMYPYIAKLNGSAKIIGEVSGGGACVVSYGVTADGKPFRMSGLSRTGKIDVPSVHDDSGVPVDSELSRDHFYDDAYLNTFVNSL
ncbi:MAG: hypothetical protein K6B65_02345 [Bacilli bacterium]|nr:hypothetical protein [Bacilli bacterium]